jgi:tRNA pseudouridine13 synthase
MLGPYLTEGLSGIGGQVRQEPEDFRVEEIPAYEPCGDGTHVYFQVTKRGLPTPAAVERIAKHMGVPRGQVGFAGLKDAHAVTSQWMSLEHVDTARLEQFRDPRISVTGITRHGNKLRTGHLRGNSFVIRIRGVGEAELDRAQSVLAVLRNRGVPNYFGPQRFGMRGDTGRLGDALVRGDAEAFLALYLGGPIAGDPPAMKAARAAFDAGDPKEARRNWPAHSRDERRVLAAFERKGAAGALLAVDKRLKRLFVSAAQSSLFNEVLARRIETLDCVEVGDLAQKTDSGGVFLVEDAEVEQPRAESFEISPTGPIVGYRSPLAEGSPGCIEQEVLTRRGLSREDFRGLGPLKAKGARRALRFKLTGAAMEAGTDERGEYVEVRFSAPSGCYATAVLREIMKPAEEIPT